MLYSDKDGKFILDGDIIVYSNTCGMRRTSFSTRLQRQYFTNVTTLTESSFHWLLKMECKLLDDGFVSKYAVLQLPTKSEKTGQFYKILSRPDGNDGTVHTRGYLCKKSFLNVA